MPKYEIDLWADAPVHRTMIIEADSPALAKLAALQEAKADLRKNASLAGVEYEVEWSAFEPDLLDVNECIELAEKG